VINLIISVSGEGKVLFYVNDGRDRMISELSSKYKNITSSDVETFLQLCVPYQQKQKGIKEGVVVKPIISLKFNY